MKLPRQMICLTALIGLVAASEVKGAAPYNTFTRTSIYAPATPIEAFMNGMANQGLANAAMIQAQAAVIKASADAVEALTRAADMREKTRGVAMDNDLKSAKYFYEKRQMSSSFQSINSRKRASKEDLIRYSKATTPPAGSYQVSTSRGIQWPEILLREDFSLMRIELDSLYQQRKPSEGGLGTEFCHEVQNLTERMRDALREQMDVFSPAEYMAARRFLDTLARDAEVPRGVSGLAAR